MTPVTVALVGNPNSGKTTLFNILTGSRQRVGNWPGVTVERKTGGCRLGGKEFEVVDLPGTYSLDVAEDELSLDEKIARDYVHGGEADLIVNIVDACNLERNLYLTTQLLEMGARLVIALNMTDVARRRGIRFDVEALAARLGCPVVPLVASNGTGVDALKGALLNAAESPGNAATTLDYGRTLERAIATLTPDLTEAARRARTTPRWLAIRLLDGDDLALGIAGNAIEPERLAWLRRDVGEDIDIMLAEARYRFAGRLTQETMEKKPKTSRNASDHVDSIVLNRILGIPIFLAVMYLMFMFTINIGGAFIDFFDILVGALLVDGLGQALTAVGCPDWLTVLLATGLGGGIRVVATFVPIIGFLYLFLAFVEDSGYMARAAFVVDRFMRWIGLPGKAFVPLIVGFGCNVPAVMAARTLEHRRDRILTVVMAPFMSCGARLPVYALFAAAFFPVGGQNVVFAMYLIGIGMAVLTGFIMKNTLLRGETTPFVMELPPYHLPTARGVLLRTWGRTTRFVLGASRVIVPMVLVLNLLNAVGTDGTLGNEQSEDSALSAVGRAITPVFSPMGLDQDNWPASVGIFTGVLAKEAVVGTLDSLYSDLGGSGSTAPADDEEFMLRAAIGEALATIPSNLLDVAGNWSDPLGLTLGDPDSAVAEGEVASGTYGAMVARFDGAAGAFAYLLFILLYFPCVAVVAAVYREASPGWAAFVTAWSTGLAYTTAVIFYQIARFSRHPAHSTGWILGLSALLAVVIAIMRSQASRSKGEELPLVAAAGQCAVSALTAGTLCGACKGKCNSIGLSPSRVQGESARGRRARARA